MAQEQTFFCSFRAVTVCGVARAVACPGDGLCELEESVRPAAVGQVVCRRPLYPAG